MTSKELREELNKQLERENCEEQVSAYLRIKRLVCEADKNSELSESDVAVISRAMWGNTVRF